MHRVANAVHTHLHMLPLSCFYVKVGKITIFAVFMAAADKEHHKQVDKELECFSISVGAFFFAN